MRPPMTANTAYVQALGDRLQAKFDLCRLPPPPSCGRNRPGLLKDHVFGFTRDPTPSPLEVSPRTLKIAPVARPFQNIGDFESELSELQMRTCCSQRSPCELFVGLEDVEFETHP